MAKIKIPIPAEPDPSGDPPQFRDHNSLDHAIPTPRTWHAI